MDFLEPKKQRRDRILLILGYTASTIAALLGAVLLSLLSQGYEGNRDNGLLFISSHPNGAQIDVNGGNMGTTGARLEIASGIYTVNLNESGYRSWQETVKIEGDSVARYNYPFLFPVKLDQTAVQQLPGIPTFSSQTPDQHWLVTQLPGDFNNFEEYDLSSTQNAAIAPVTLTLPTGLLSSSTGAAATSVVGWDTGSNYLLLKHTYDNNADTEYILLDRTDPASSVNLTKSFDLNATDTLALDDGAYNRYYVYDPTSQTISQANLGQSGLTTLISKVISFSTGVGNSILYVTPDTTTKLNEAVLYQGGQNFPIRKLPVTGNYLLAVDQYSGDWYVAVGDSTSGQVFIYEDPADQYYNSSNHTEAPLSALNVTDPTSLSFSPSAQFVEAEHDSTFSVYDVANDVAYNYQLAQPVDVPQAGTTWMDGDHMMYISGGKLIVFDYDGSNLQTLMAASPSYVPAFDANYDYAYTLNSQTTNSAQEVLKVTPLLVSSGS